MYHTISRIVLNSVLWLLVFCKVITLICFAWFVICLYLHFRKHQTHLNPLLVWWSFAVRPLLSQGLAAFNVEISADIWMVVCFNWMDVITQTHRLPDVCEIFDPHNSLKRRFFNVCRYPSCCWLAPLNERHPLPLQWRHNGHYGVSNHQPHHCSLDHIFRLKSKKTSKLCVTGLCAGNSPVTGEFPAQRAINAENVSI